MRKKTKEILKGIGFVILALGFVVASVYISNLLNKQDFTSDDQIEPTGEKEYACTNEWQEDKVIQDCKWYPIYRRKLK